MNTKINKKLIAITFFVMVIISNLTLFSFASANPDPTFTNVGYTTNIQGQSCTISAIIVDSTPLTPNGFFQYSTNVSGSDVWSSIVNFTNTYSQPISTTFTITNNVGDTIKLVWNAVNNNQIGTQYTVYITVTEQPISTPQISEITYSNTKAGSNCTLTALATDTISLSTNGQWQFGTNNTESGTWIWSTAQNFTQQYNQEIGVTMTLNSYAGNTIAFMWNATNNAGISNFSEIQTFITTINTSTTNQTIYTYDTNTTATLWMFVIFNAILIFGAIIAYLWVPVIGIGFGVTGIFGTGFFALAENLVLTSITDINTGIVTVTLMPIGYFVLMPIALTILNICIPIVKMRKH